MTDEMVPLNLMIPWRLYAVVKMPVLTNVAGI